MEESYQAWMPRYQYSGRECLFGTNRAQGNTAIKANNALLMNWNPDSHFNGLLAVSNGKWLSRITRNPHGAQYDKQYHIVNIVIFFSLLVHLSTRTILL